jgi:predicted secreted protein
MSDYGSTPPPPPPPPGSGGYGAPPPGSGGYGAPPPSDGGMGAAPPDNKLVWSILVTIFCCLPFGIVAIIKSAEVNSKWAAGDQAGARQSAADAGKWIKWSVIVGVIAAVVSTIFYVITFIVAASTTSGGGY